jgi:tRNA (guanine-N7-)-methyltransferase
MFCLDHANKNSNMNILGLEIRKPIAAVCVKKAEESELRNVGFICCNANVDLERIINDLNVNSHVARVSIQFPDPYFKAKQQKRRVVQKSLVDTIAKTTDERCDVYLQSDVKGVAEDMRDRFRQHDAFIDTVDSFDEWLDTNPTGTETEREVGARENGLDVYRCLFKRRT